MVKRFNSLRKIHGFDFCLSLQVHQRFKLKSNEEVQGQPEKFIKHGCIHLENLSKIYT